MYFSIQPKTSKKDLFNFDGPYEELKQAVKKGEDRLVVVSGLRRTGKTSLIKVVYNELTQPKLYIDSREIFPLTPKNVQQYFTSTLLTFAKKYDLAQSILGHIKAAEFGLRIEFTENTNTLSGMLKAVDSAMLKKKTGAIIFIDEAQLLKTVGFDKVLAYIYDNLSQLQLVLAGSEIGLLEEFTGKEKDAALFGRAKKIIWLNRLSPENSLLFLKTGFKQIKKPITEIELHTIVNEIDGIIGWLAMYGWHSSRMEKMQALKTVLEEGSKIAAGEIETFLHGRAEAKGRYIHILKALSIQPLKWSEIKKTLELKESKEIGDAHIASYLENLIKYGFIEKGENHYQLTDPLFKKGLEHMR